MKTCFMTFRRLQLVSRPFTPARRVNVRGVRVHPEVMAVRIPIEVELYPKSTHLIKEMNKFNRSVYTKLIT